MKGVFWIFVRKYIKINLNNSMSEEKGGEPKKWADDNVNVRWKFTDDHKDLIYELIEENE